MRAKQIIFVGALLFITPFAVAETLATLPQPSCSQCASDNHSIYTEERRLYPVVSMSPKQVDQAQQDALSHSRWFPNDTPPINPKNGKYVLRTNWYRERPYVSLGRRLPAPGDTSMQGAPVGSPTTQSVLESNFNIPGNSSVGTQLPLHINLREAVLLALRNNPEVVNSELQRIVDKFAVVAAFNFFEPQYQLSGSANFAQGVTPSYSAQPGVSITTPLGTVLSANYTGSIPGVNGSSPGGVFAIQQPILKGAGYAYNTINWYNALDTNDIAKLTFKYNVMQTVVAVIQSYRTIVQDNNNIQIQKGILARTKKMVETNQLRVKVGKLAPSDLIQEQANLAEQQLNLQQTYSQLYNDYQNLLKNLGLISTAKVLVSNEIDVTGLKRPNLAACIQTALSHNVPYNQAVIQINLDQRALIAARNQARWQLTMTANLATNSNASVTPPGQNQTTINTIATGPSVGFSLNVPIDNVQEKQAIVQAQIALDQAKVTVAEQKEELVRSITNQVQQIDNQFDQVNVAELSVKLNEHTYKDVMIKLKYGKTTVFEANSLRDNLLQSQTSLVEAKITLLNLITDLNEQLGITLDKWHIKLRY